MPIRIITVGKKHEDWVADGITRYQKRLKVPFTIEWDLLPHSSLQGDSARQEESQRIISRLKTDDYVILLDERGRQCDSPMIASLFKSQLDHSVSIAIIIGGAYGVTDEVRQRSQFVWSLSPLVFPHQLVRLILIEQLYRCQEITRGGPYHHL